MTSMPMKDVHQRNVLNRLKTARGHLDGIIRMVEDDAYCPDLMKQLSAVQGSLERASRLVLRNHLETCVAAAMRAGRTEEIVDELMEGLRYDRIASRPRGAELPPPDPRAAPRAAPHSPGAARSAA